MLGSGSQGPVLTQTQEASWAAVGLWAHRCPHGLGLEFSDFDSLEMGPCRRGVLIPLRNPPV